MILNRISRAKWIYIAGILMLSGANSFAQIGISNTSITPHASSVLELRSTTSGFLPPRMTTLERDAISTPAAGLLIYNTTSNQLNYYTGSAWQAVVTGSSISSLNGLTGPTQTFVNGTNLTMTSTGTTHTLGWTGQLSVAQGGTGLSTFGGTNKILYTSTTDNLSSITTANNGVLVTNGTGVPSIGTSLPSAVQTNITSLGTIGTGVWNGTSIADGKIAAALTGKTYNGLSLTSQATGFTISGGTSSKILTVGADASVSGTNTGDQVNITGNAATVTTNANLNGEVTSIGNTTTIANGAVTNTKLANMAAYTFKGNNTASAAPPIDLTATEATAGLNTFSSGLKGLVPASGGGTANFLRADGTWTAPAAGTVSSVSITTANGVSGSVATATTTPAISLTLGAITPSSVAASGTVTGSNLSGTNTGDQTTITGNAGSATLTAVTDDIATAGTMYPTWVGTASGNQAQKTSSTKLFFNPSTGILTATGFAGNLTGSVTGNASTVTTNANLTGDVTSSGNATTIGALKVTNGMIANTTIDLTTKVTGVLPIARGGTNIGTLGSAGSVIYSNGTQYASTAVGTAGQVLQSNGSSAPTWVTRNDVNIVTLASDVSNNNSTANTLQNVTGLSFPVSAGVTYSFQALILYTTASTSTGSRWSVSGPSSPTMLAYRVEYPSSATVNTTASAVTYDQPANSNSNTPFSSGNICTIHGVITPSASGTLIVRFASEIANSAITAQAGSTLTWW